MRSLFRLLILPIVLAVACLNVGCASTGVSSPTINIGTAASIVQTSSALATEGVIIAARSKGMNPATVAQEITTVAGSVKTLLTNNTGVTTAQAMAAASNAISVTPMDSQYTPIISTAVAGLGPIIDQEILLFEQQNPSDTNTIANTQTLINAAMDGAIMGASMYLPGGTTVVIPTTQPATPPNSSRATVIPRAAS